MEALKVSISGVRGVVGGSLTPQVACSFAQAFGAFVGKGTVLVGRDTRPTGPMIEQAVVAGLQSVGCTPVRLGIVPTPTVLFLVRHLRAHGGICITASHNPVQWNAMKFAGSNGLFLDEMQAQELFDIYHQHDHELVDEPALRPAASLVDPVRDHFARVVAYVDAGAIRARGFKVAIDCCNGVGALHSVAFLESLGCTVVPVLDTPGVFEREPEPLPEHLDALRAAVKDHGCALGFAQDPDGDRLAVVDERGEPLGEDLTLVLAVQQVLDAHQRGPVVVNMSSSKTVEAVAERFGVEVIRTRIGEIHVSSRMLSEGSVVGGENSGGVIIPAIHPCRDSYAGMAVILELLAGTEEPVSAVRARFPRYHLVKEKLEVHAREVPRILRRLRHHYEDRPLNLLDGVFIDFETGWAHVRPSNTEPVMRVLAEASTGEEARKLCGELRGLIEAGGE